MATQLQIVNTALDFLNEQPITDIDSTTDPRAIKAKRQWTLTLNEFMALAPWHWAKTRTTLTPDSPAPDFGWSASYTLPSDFVTLVGLNETYADTPSDLYEVNGLTLLCDEDTADIEYIKTFVVVAGSSAAPDIDDFLEPMDHLCAQALALLLASRLAAGIAQDGLTKAITLTQLFEQAISRARVRNGNHQRRAPELPGATSSALAARRSFRNN